MPCAKPASGPCTLRRTIRPPGVAHSRAGAPGNCRVERACAGADDALAARELHLALEHEERVHLVAVLGGRRCRATPGSTSSRKTESSGSAPRIVFTRSSRSKRSPPPGRRDDGVRGRPAAVGGRRVLVEVACGRGGSRANPAPGAWKFRKRAARRARRCRSRARRPGGTTDERAGRAAITGARLRGRRCRVSSPCEHVERVDVLVGGRAGSAPRSPGRVARPGDGQPVVLAEDPQLAVRPVGDRLALDRARPELGALAYVELHCHSAYSFLDGASQPEELAARAAELGYEALALTDHDGVYGSLEFAHAAKAFGVRADHRRRDHTRGRKPTSRCSSRRRRATRTSAGC